MKNLNFDNLYKTTVFLVFAIAFVFVLIVGQSIIVPLVVSFFLAFLILPLCNFLEKYRFPRWLAAIVSMLLAISVIAGIVLFFGSQVNKFSKDLDGIAEKVDVLKSRLPAIVSDSLSGFSSGGVVEFLKDNFGEIFTGLAGFVGSFTFAIVVPIYVVLILIYRNLLREFVYRIMDNIAPKPESDEEMSTPKRGIRDLLPRIKGIVQKYIVGMFYVMCILFILYSAALLSLGIEHALLFAAFAAVLNIIPFVGPWLGSILPIVFALLTKDSLFYPAAVLVAFAVIQTVEGNLITPNIVGRNVSLNPLVTLLTLFIGAAIWGVVGMILFIPLMAVLKEIIGNIDGLEPYAYVLGTGEDPLPPRRK